MLYRVATASVKIFRILFFAVAAAIGSLFIFLGVQMFPDKTVYTDEVTAYISGFSYDGYESQIAKVNYDYDGQSYHDEPLSWWSSSMRVGDAVRILVNPDDPTDFVDASPTFGIIFVIAGGIAVLVGAGTLLSGFFDRRIQKQMENAAESRYYAFSPDTEKLAIDDAFVLSYTFAETNRLKSEYELKDEYGQTVYKNTLIKRGLLTGDEYEFKNTQTYYAKTYHITKTTEQGGTSSDFGAMVGKSFIWDGQTNWDYLRGLGYELKAFGLEDGGVQYSVYHLNGKVAEIRVADGYKEFGNKALFTVKTSREEMDAVYAVCFSLAKTCLS